MRTNPYNPEETCCGNTIAECAMNGYSERIIRLGQTSDMLEVWVDCGDMEPVKFTRQNTADSFFTETTD